MGLISRLGSIVLAAAVSLGQGCAVTPSREYNSIALRSGLETSVYSIDIGEKVQTTPTHPDDSIQPTETSAKLSSHYGNGVRLGLENSYGNDDYRLGIGWDTRYVFCRDGGRLEMLAEKRQETNGSESYAFTRLTPMKFGHALFVRGEKKVYGNIRLGAEVGFPYSGFTVESGRDRYGKWETLRKERWSGFGRLFRLTLDAGLSERYIMSFSAGFESFEPDFGGESGRIQSVTASGGITISF